MLIILDPQGVNIFERLLDNGKVLFKKYFCGHFFYAYICLCLFLLLFFLLPITCYLDWEKGFWDELEISYWEKGFWDELKII